MRRLFANGATQSRGCWHRPSAEGLVGPGAQAHHAGGGVMAASQAGRGAIMAATKPPVIGTAVAAWADAFNVIGAMPLVAGIALAIMIVVSLLGVAFLPNALGAAPWMLVYTVVFSIIQALLLAPLAIVVHRYVLLGEVTDRYPLDPSSTRYMRFVSFAILVKVIGALPGVVDAFIPVQQESAGRAAVIGAAILVLFVVIIVVVVRRAILFPAIAIDAPGATWSNARRDTKGSSWRVFLIFVCVALPAIIISIPLWYVTLRSGFGGGSRIMFAIVGSVVDIPTLCAFAAAASHIYRARADNLTMRAT